MLFVYIAFLVFMCIALIAVNSSNNSNKYETEFFNVRYWNKSSGSVESMVVVVRYDIRDKDSDNFIKQRIEEYIKESDKAISPGVVGQSPLVDFEKIPNL